MGLDEELESLEEAARKRAEAAEELEELEVFEIQADESELEVAYESFFEEEGPNGEGEVSLFGDDGGLAAVASPAEEDALAEGGFHLVSEDDNTSLIDDFDEGSDAVDVDETLLDEDEPDASDEEDDDYELVELEIDDDDIVCYLEDEEGNRVGFVLLEDGEEVEYFYVEDDEDGGEEVNEFDMGITKEGVKEVTNDANAIYKDGVAIASELKDAFVDIKEAFDFSFLKNK